MTYSDIHLSQRLLHFISQATSPYHTVKASAAILKEAGFRELRWNEPWQLEPRQGYYISLYDSSLIAFTIGPNPRANLRIAAAHTDFPCLRVKPAAALSQQGYGKLNVEIYGGMIRESWLDRPLSLAGKVAVASDDPFKPAVHLIDARRPLLTIPRLAIHMNSHVNDGVALNPQKDMLPLMTLTGPGDDASYFLQFLAAECHCRPEDILSYDLTVYLCEEGCLMGLKNEFISSPRLDNLTSAYACVDSLIRSKGHDGLHVVALFDNEEVGSRTKQGALSQAFPALLEELYASLGYTRREYRIDTADAFILSIDVAHAMHPNVPEKCDLTNMPRLGQGVALKTAASQSYAGDAEASAAVVALCRRAHIPCQRFVNRSDMPGGSTLGSLLSANLPIRTMDIGIPILAMHSARELMGAADQKGLHDLVYTFFSI